MTQFELKFGCSAGLDDLQLFMFWSILINDVEILQGVTYRGYAMDDSATTTPDVSSMSIKSNIIYTFVLVNVDWLWWSFLILDGPKVNQLWISKQSLLSEGFNHF